MIGGTPLFEKVPDRHLYDKHMIWGNSLFEKEYLMDTLMDKHMIGGNSLFEKEFLIDTLMEKHMIGGQCATNHVLVLKGVDQAHCFTNMSSSFGFKL